MRDNMEKSKILELYNIDERKLDYARELTRAVRETLHRYNTLNGEIKKLISKRAKLKAEMHSREEAFAGSSETLGEVDEIASDIDEMDRRIREFRQQLLSMSSEIQNNQAELKNIGDEIARKFIDALEDAKRKRDEYFAIARSYDNEYVRINRMLNETGIFRPLHAFRREVSDGVVITSITPQDFKSWKVNPHPEWK